VEKGATCGKCPQVKAKMRVPCGKRFGGGSRRFGGEIGEFVGKTVAIETF
jgi:hypothetical protein